MRSDFLNLPFFCRAPVDFLQAYGMRTDEEDGPDWRRYLKTCRDRCEAIRRVACLCIGFSLSPLPSPTPTALSWNLALHMEAEQMDFGDDEVLVPRQLLSADLRTWAG